MELINSTRMPAGYTLATQPDGREHLVVAIKGTFRIPASAGAVASLHEEQAPLELSDIFFGEPGLSAPKYEYDFAPRKARCDLLLNAQAYAPGGRPAERVTVKARIGDWSKSFVAVGDRAWFTTGTVSVTSPEPFAVMPLGYDRAFGGVDLHHESQEQHAAFLANPVGRGFHKHLKSEWLDGSPLPNTEVIGSPVTAPDGRYRPMSFGPLGRHWEPRCHYAGTYDQRWLDEQFPFLPVDFDPAYYQAAPPDQQIDLPSGPLQIVLENLTPDGLCAFTLPFYEAPVHFIPKGGERRETLAHLDTIVVEPDLGRAMLTWRAIWPLRRSLFEMNQVVIGRRTEIWWRRNDGLGFPIPIRVEPMPPRTHSDG